MSSACLSEDCRELQAARLPAEIISSQMEAVSKFVVQQGLLLLVLLLYHWSAMEKSKVITNKVKPVFDVFSRFSCHSFGLSTNQLLTDIELSYTPFGFWRASTFA